MTDFSQMEAKPVSNETIPSSTSAPIPIPIRKQRSQEDIRMSRFYNEYGPTLIVPNHRTTSPSYRDKRKRTKSLHSRPELEENWRSTNENMIARSAPK
jgi:hypothetical protein